MCFLNISSMKFLTNFQTFYQTLLKNCLNFLLLVISKPIGVGNFKDRFLKIKCPETVSSKTPYNGTNNSFYSKCHSLPVLWTCVISFWNRFVGINFVMLNLNIKAFNTWILFTIATFGLSIKYCIM